MLNIGLSWIKLKSCVSKIKVLLLRKIILIIDSKTGSDTMAQGDERQAQVF